MVYANVTTIVLNGDIKTTDRVLITRNVTIDGAGHVIDASAATGTGWGIKNDGSKFGYGLYVVQVYSNGDTQVSATLKDIKLTGGDVALLANGSNVTLSGTVDVSGNEFSGIELSKGVAVSTVPSLNLDNTKLLNTTEYATNGDGSTIVIDGGNGLDISNVSVKYNGIQAAVSAPKDVTGKDIDKIQLFLDETKAPTGAGYEKLDVAKYQPEQPTNPDPKKPSDTEKPADTDKDQTTDTEESEGKADGYAALIGILAVLSLGAYSLRKFA